MRPVLAAIVLAALLDPRAQTLLDRADALLQTRDYAAAIQKYIDAVKADPAAADLDRIDRYAPAILFITREPSAEEREENARRTKAEPLRVAALRQFVQLHPDDWSGAQQLLGYADRAEAESLMKRWIERQPRDPEMYRTRGALRMKHGDHAGALDDFRKSVQLDPENPERHYVLGVVLYERVAKSLLPEAEKRPLIGEGIASLTRAESLKPDYFESIVYRNLLLRERAKLETDETKRDALMAEADAVRQKAVDLMNARRRAAAPPPEPGQPLPVGGDVKAPVVITRVAPEYPELAAKARIRGIVIVRAIIDKEGRVREVEILKPLPFGLDEAAAAAVKQWTFQPGTLDGEPVDVSFNLTVKFPPDPE